MNGTITINGAIPTLNEVTLVEKTVNVVGGEAEDQTVQATATSAKGTNITTGVKWSVTSNGGSGVTVDEATGLITVDAKAKDGAYTITATPDGINSQGAAKTATLTVTRATSTVISVNITGDEDTLTVPNHLADESGNRTYNYAVTVEDQFGDVSTPDSVEWSITYNDSPVTGVSIANGVVTVTGDAESTVTDSTGLEFTITATVDGVTGTKEVTIAREESKLGWVDFTQNGPSSDKTVTAPALTEDAATLQYGAVVRDQYGEELSGYSVTWSLENAPKGVSIDQTGKVTVQPGAEAGQLDVKITCEGHSISIGLTVQRAESVATTVKIFRDGTELGGTDTVVKPVTGGAAKEYTYSAQVLDQYGSVMEEAQATLSMTESSVTGVTFENNALKVTADAEKGTNVTLTASYGSGTPVTASVTVTITDLDVNWSGITTNDITYGDANSKAVTPPASGEADAAGTKVTGTFSVENANTIQAVGSGTITVTVKFTADDKVAEYAGVVVTKDYTVSIQKRPVTVTLDDLTRAYGAANPTLTYAITSGELVNGDELTALGITPSCTADTASPAGTPVAITAAASSANYEVTVVDGTLTITKADIISVTDPTTFTAIPANDSANASADALLNAVKNGRETLNAAYANGSTTVNAEWKLTTGTWDIKGGTYTYTATLTPTDATNFNATTITKTLSVTITPVKVTAITGSKSITLSKSQVNSAANLAALGVDAKVTLTFDNGVANQEIDADWNKTLGDVKAVANTVTETSDKKVTLTLTDANIPAWATVDVAMPKVEITITNKYVIPADDITFNDITTTYGSGYAPTASVADKSEYTGVEYAYTYNGSKTLPTDAGTYTLTVTVENANYKGTKTATLTINKKSLANSMLTITGEYTYTGSAIMPTYTVSDKPGETELIKASDYTVEVTNNTNAWSSGENAPTVTIKAAENGNYSGEASKTFTIAAKDLTGAAAISGLNAEYTYTGSDIQPAVTVKDGDKVLVKDTDYTVAYTNDTAVGEATVTVTFQGNYTGTASATYAIVAAPFTGTVTITGNDYQVGTQLTARVTGTYGTLTYAWYRDGVAIEGAASSTYTLTDDDAGKSIIVKVTSTGNYAGDITSAAIEVGKAPLPGTLTLIQADNTITATANGIPKGSYDIVWLRSGAAISGATGTEYTITAADKGATVTAKAVAKGDTYTGEIVATGISVAATVPGAPTVTATVSDGQVTISWTVADNGGAAITGYTVQLGSETAIALDAAATSYTFTGLTNGEEYTFKVTATNSVGTSDAGSTVAIPASSGGNVLPPDTGSGSGSGSSADKPVTSGGTSTVTTVVSPTISNGVAQVIVPSGQMNSAVNAVVTAAVENGTAPVLEIEVGTVRTADSLSVQVPAPALAILAGHGDAVLTIQSELVTVSLDSAAVSAVARQSGSTVTLTLTPVGADELNSRQQAVVGDAPVYDLSFTSGGAVISDLQGGMATVTLPHTLDEDENPNGVVVYFLDEMGNLEACESVYSVRDKAVTFTTTHFSLYMVGYDESVEWNVFTDVNADGWAAPYIYDLYERGIVGGVTATTFQPTRNITRAEFVKILAGVAGVTADNLPTAPSAFTDVESGSWYEPYVVWAVNNGVTTGTSDTTFSPNKTIKREEMAAMIYRYAVSAGITLPETEPAVTFTDAASFSDWAVEAIQAMQRAGIISGMGDDTFAPASNATREQACKMLSVLLGIMEQK